MRRHLTPFAILAVATALSAPARADLRIFDSDPAEAKPAGDPTGFKLDLYGWVQPRFTMQESDDRPEVNLHPNPAFTVERARLGTVARLGKWARAQVEVDFSKETAAPVDAYVVLTAFDEQAASLNLTMGQFRVPFSRQNLLPSKSLQFSDLAYFVSPKYIVDRDIGMLLWGDIASQRIRWSIGVYNGNDPGKGQTLNTDPDFLFAGRLELHPLGRVPDFEGDLRSLEERHHPLFELGGGAMRNRYQNKQVERNYVGADAGAWFEGASLYGEFYYHVDEPLFATGIYATTEVRQLGWNVQAGYFPPLPWVRQHIELVGRVEFLDPNLDVKHPASDSSAMEIEGSNPSWGYLGLLVGANLFWNYGHNLKLQGNYEIRDETKACLQGQSGTGCTGYVNNNLFVLQLTGAF